jgi:hypothetical protein
MAFESILYEEGEDGARNAPREAPDYFHDLIFDQIIDAITKGKEEYDLKPFFYDSLKTTDAILYRHEVMRDLEDDGLLECIRSFANNMRQMRQKIAQANKLHYKYQKEQWFLQAVLTYCAAVRELQEGLSRFDMASRGFLAFRDYVRDYIESNAFMSLLAAANKLTDDLATIHYCMLIRDGGFKVRKYDSEQDYSAEVTDTFRKFQQGAARDYRVSFSEPIEMNHIEAQVLEFVTLLHREMFGALDAFYAQNQKFADQVLKDFDREIQFYVAYIEYTSRFKRVGLPFCYPRVSATDKEIQDVGGFDLALATRLIATKTPIVCNDLCLNGKERIFVVSGPNQGGKTTFARTFGQLHHLASIGCTVPGTDAQLFLFDSMFAHFEREENIENLHGKLQDDLIRIHDVLERATPRSIIVMNEIFSSTTLQDAVFLARMVVERIIELDCLCVCVTFLEELASLSEKTVSMVSTVLPGNPASRTYRVVRRPADGRSYAISIAEKYRLTYECLKQRLPS